MWWLVLCHITWCNAMSWWWAVVCCGLQWDGMLWALRGHAVWFEVVLSRCGDPTYYSVLNSITLSVLQSTTPVLRCTTKYYSSTTPYFKVLLQYYSVLQSTTDPATDIKTSKHFTSKHKTSPPGNGRRLVHSKEMILAQRWSVALRTFHRQIISLLYSSSSLLKLPPPARPGTTCVTYTFICSSIHYFRLIRARTERFDLRYDSGVWFGGMIRGMIRGYDSRRRKPSYQHRPGIEPWA